MAALLLLCCTFVNAHDFEVDGIYYNNLSRHYYIKTVEVTFKGDSYNDYSNEYAGDVTIPESVTIDGVTYSVGVIGEYAFSDCDSLTSIEIPSSVTRIGYYAFRDCDALTSIEIPNSVTSIGGEAFYNCTGLTSIEIPSSVTSIEGYAFYNCTGLTSIEIPSSVTSIGDHAFHSTAWFDNQPDGVLYVHKVLYTYKGTMPTDTHILIKDGTLEISNYAFWGCDGLTSIEIPNSVTSIGYGAFYGCTGLTSIEIPSSVTSIEGNAFSSCTDLTSIVVDENNTAYDSRENCNAIIETSSNTLIKGCKNTVIPNSVTSIGIEAFYGCTGLTSIEIPNSVTSIEGNAFSSCTDLTSIEIPNSVTSIGDWAFFGCTSLISIKISSSVTRIDAGVFNGCTSLESIVVDENNTAYDSRENCNAIIKTASNTLIRGCNNSFIPSSVTSIGGEAFYGCTGLTSIEIPSSVTSIGEGAFCFCTDLTSIEIPNSVTSIGKCAFQYCRELASIEIPSSVTSIEGNAFSSCTDLTSIEIPNSVTSIGDWAFSHCTSLTSIKIPNSITNIGISVFQDCTGLTSIISRIPADKLFVPNEYAFFRIDKTKCTLYVPYGAAATYAATDGWNDFTCIIEFTPKEYTLTVSAAGYATMYLDYAAEIPEGVEVYTAGRIEDDRLKMQPVEDVIPANTGVIVRANEGTYSFAESSETPAAVSDNLLTGTVADTYVKPAAATAYVLSQVDGVIGMYKAKLKADGTFKNNANKAYILLGGITTGEGNLDTSNPGGQLSNGYRFDFGGTTAIESVETESAAPAVYYDLSGRRVENPVKGIYIVNGRKVLIK